MSAPRNACGTPTGGDDAERVAIAGDVLDRDPALLAADSDAHGAPVGGQRLEPLPGGRGTGAFVRAAHPGGDLVGSQVAQPAQEVVHRIGRARRSVGRQELELELQLGQRVRVEQLAQLLGAEQLAQQVAVERQRLGATVDERRVALVHVRGDVVEHQRARERRRAPRLDAHEPDLAPLDGGQDALQRGQVEDVLEAPRDTSRG